MLRGYASFSGVSLVARIGNVYAIVVGCAGYPSPISQLPECLNDADNMTNYLRQKLDASSENIKLLKDTASSTSDDVTPTVIQNAVTSWLKGKNPTSFDTVYFHYAGHGSNGGVICPQAMSLTPSTLNSYLTKVSGTKIVIYDSCHSGGALSSVGDRMLAACRDDENSKNCYWSGRCLLTGLSGGVFTSYLLDEAGKTGNDSNKDGIVSLLEAFSPAKARIESWQGWVDGGVKMHPQIR